MDEEIKTEVESFAGILLASKCMWAERRTTGWVSLPGRFCTWLHRAQPLWRTAKPCGELNGGARWSCVRSDTHSCRPSAVEAGIGNSAGALASPHLTGQGPDGEETWLQKIKIKIKEGRKGERQGKQ